MYFDSYNLSIYSLSFISLFVYLSIKSEPSFTAFLYFSPCGIPIVNSAHIMDIKIIIIAVVILSVTGALAALLLSIASKVFAVPVDELKNASRIPAINTDFLLVQIRNENDLL